MDKKLFFGVFFLLGFLGAYAQAGIAVTPGRMYYRLGPGSESIQKIKVTNPTDWELEVGVSFSDWDYTEAGANNIQDAGSLENSCSDWIQVLPDTYFVLDPGETKEVEVLMKVPSDADVNLPVRTSMVFFTQLNPGQTSAQQGAGIQVTVKVGVKVYHSFEKESASDLDIVDFKKLKDNSGKDIVDIYVKNMGRIWTNGVIDWEVFNKNTGKKTKLSKKEFYTLPNDLRVVRQSLPQNLDSGEYTITAVLTYGDNDVIKIAEMDFSQ